MSIMTSTSSASTGAPLPPTQVYFGEIGLSGAVRPVIHAGPRLKEAGKLGFRYAVLPQMQQTNDEDDSAGVTPRPLSDVGALVAEIARAAARLRASG